MKMLKFLVAVVIGGLFVVSAPGAVAQTLEASLTSDAATKINFWTRHRVSWTSQNASTCELKVGNELLAQGTSRTVDVSYRVNPTYTLMCRAASGQTITRTLTVATCDRRQTLVGTTCAEWVKVQRWNYAYKPDPSLRLYNAHFYAYQTIGVPNYAGTTPPNPGTETSPGYALKLSELGRAPGLLRVRHFYNDKTGDHYYTTQELPVSRSTDLTYSQLTANCDSVDVTLRPFCRAYEYQSGYDFAWFKEVRDQTAPLQPVYQWSKLERLTTLPGERFYQDHLFSATADGRCAASGAARDCGAEFVSPASNAYNFEDIQGYLYFDTDIAKGPTVTQCSDGLDNDGDGAVDSWDFSCSGSSDNDETSPKSQCQNGADDDSDGVVDFPEDPGCATAQDNNEGDGTTQCQDGIDNDNDGATDLADFSCSSRTDNDETNPKSQCQDGIDNDSDGLTDLADPDCTNRQDNTESGSRPQCNDSIDNDMDGAIDFPSDFSCGSLVDNDESLPKSQCQDGLDNDSDGLTDLADPDCANGQDNTESGSKPQCNDSIDNDMDGAIDFPTDFSCANQTDNDESLPKSQCQDGLDNDSDGLTDLADPDCANGQDDTEGGSKSQCNDGVDNDNDNAIDLLDPGCSDANDNNESDEPSLFTVGVECVTNNSDNSTTAYFSYNNTSNSDISFSTNAQTGTLNEFVAGTTTAKPPTTFKPGAVKGSVSVTFTGSVLTWVVRAPKSALSQASANANTPKCSTVTPIAECRGYVNGVMKVRLGYNNPNTFNQQFAIGALNRFTQGTADRGQPSQFFPGLNKSVAEVTLASQTEVTSWSVNGAAAAISPNLPTCDGQCSDTATGAITGNLDRIAGELSQVMNRAAELLASSKARSGADARRNRNDAERAKRKASEYETLANALTIQFPGVVKTCPEAPPFCITVDRQGTIDALRGLYANQRNSTVRTVARSFWRNLDKTKRNDKLVKQAKSLEQEGITELTNLPRFAVECK